MRASRSRFLARARARTRAAQHSSLSTSQSPAHDLSRQITPARLHMGSTVPSPPSPNTVTDSHLTNVYPVSASHRQSTSVSTSSAPPTPSTASRATSFSSAIQSGKARFRVKFSDVALVFPTSSFGTSQSPLDRFPSAQLSLSFDSFWTAETISLNSVTCVPDPDDPSASRYPLQFVSFSAQLPKPKVLDEPTSDLRFIYETSLAHKLHRKYLVLTLNSASDATPPTGVLSIESLARGCQRIAMSFADPADSSAPPVAVAYFRVSMLHFDRVQAVISDLKVADYPERYIHDVKLVFLEMGYQAFVDGYISSTEKSSDAEPLFLNLPTLERVCSLQEMLHGGATTSLDLRIFFSVHRQVARSRTEEIGLGALPVHMLFSKVEGGKMDIPSKFKVPLAGFKGVVRGKVILRNISQWSQLGGDDLLNRDGVIYPTSVDLQTRKLLPWLPLARNVQPFGTPSPAVRPFSSPNPPQTLHSSASAGSAGSGTISEPNSLGHLYPPPSVKWPENSHSSAYLLLPPNMVPLQGASPAQTSAAVGAPQVFGVSQSDRSQNVASEVAAVAGSAAASNGYHVSPEFQTPASDLTALSNGTGGFTGVIAYSDPATSVSHQGRTHGYHGDRIQGGQAQDGASVAKQGVSAGNEQSGSHNIAQQQQYYLSEQAPTSSQYPGTADYISVQNPLDAQFQNLNLRNASEHISAYGSQDISSGGAAGKSGRSAVSSNAGQADPAGYSNGSEDALLVQQGARSGIDAQAVEGVVSPEQAGIVQPPFTEWIAVKDVNSDNFYFANYSTNESLWLPPLWERRFDENGYEFFVDHGSKTTQREFPAMEARSYRDRMYAGATSSE